MPGMGRPPIGAWRVVGVISLVIIVLALWALIDLLSRLFK